METEIKETTTFRFEELDPEVQERVLDEQRTWNTEGIDWWDCVYEDAKHMGALMGIEIANIHFTGFYSQGDGACFQGHYECKPDAVEAIKAETDDKELLHIAEKFTQLQVEVKMTAGITFECKIESRGNYCHSGTMGLGDWGLEAFSEIPDTDMTVRGWCDEFLTLFRAFADWIYERLEAEYEYLESDESVKQALEDEVFDEDGRLIR